VLTNPSNFTLHRSSATIVLHPPNLTIPERKASLSVLPQRQQRLRIKGHRLQ
jgi:hypothetical protein